MKKATFYARVSSDLQKKERTIESQIVELKKQIAADGNVLVKEYIDDGFTGARLDRPAMDEMRKDLRTNLFDVVYFLNTDRIAREVTYQTIIIAEILKHKKQIIINGKDYVHNPENKFTVTVLGAVSELERAKIIERTTRGKQLRLAQGQLLGCGNNVYGYDFHKRTPTSDPYYTVNEIEAKIVRFVFETYSKGGIGTNQITRQLEAMGAPTKRGKNIWRTSIIKCMTRNEMYTGIRYFNTMRLIREYANPMHGIKVSSRKIERRDRSEWIGVKVPAIVSQELFNKVQQKVAYNRQKYRNPKMTQLLSSLVRCGHCKGSFFALRSYYRDKRTNPPTVTHRAAYKCNWKSRQHMHHKQTALKRCHNREIKAEILEAYVFKIIREVMLEPSKIKRCMTVLNNDSQTAQKKLERQLRYLDQKVKEFGQKKRRLVEIYASGNIEKDDYILKNLKFDNEVNALKMERVELVKRIPLLHKTEVIDTSIARYCESAKAQLEKCDDFDSKRKFLLEHVSKVIFDNGKFEVFGSVPIHLKEYIGKRENEETGKIDFSIRDEIPRMATLGRKDRKPNFKEPISRKEYDLARTK